MKTRLFSTVLTLLIAVLVVLSVCGEGNAQFIKVSVYPNIERIHVLELTDRMEHKRSLSPSDLKAKKAIISTLAKGPEGTVYQSSLITINYNNVFDHFMVKINTTKVNLARKEAVKWFKDHGLSQEAICNIPVEFVLDSDVADKLNKLHAKYDSLAPNCI